MHHMTRRALLAGASIFALLAFAPAIQADEVKSGAFTIRRDGKICEREARLKIKRIMERMISAAERRAGGKLSKKKKDAWLTGGWNAARGIIKQHYAFYD